MLPFGTAPFAQSTWTLIYFRKLACLTFPQFWHHFVKHLHARYSWTIHGSPCWDEPISEPKRWYCVTRCLASTEQVAKSGIDVSLMASEKMLHICTLCWMSVMGEILFLWETPAVWTWFGYISWPAYQTKWQTAIVKLYTRRLKFVIWWEVLKKKKLLKLKIQFQKACTAIRVFLNLDATAKATSAIATISRSSCHCLASVTWFLGYVK